MVNRERALVKSGPQKGSVRMKALMLELNFPVQIESRDRGSGYSYGKKWTYLNGKWYTGILGISAVLTADMK